MPCFARSRFSSTFEWRKKSNKLFEFFASRLVTIRCRKPGGDKARRLTAEWR